MKISELIEELQEAQNQYGDMEVAIIESLTGNWLADVSTDVRRKFGKGKPLTFTIEAYAQ